MGRPPIDKNDRRAFPLSMRVSRELADMVEAAAKANGKSKASEVEYRIRRSFEVDDILARLGAALP